MPKAKVSLNELNRDLEQATGVINILERARQELATILDWDEALRANPMRRTQFRSIGRQLEVARGRKTTIVQMIEQLEPRT